MSMRTLRAGLVGVAIVSFTLPFESHTYAKVQCATCVEGGITVETEAACAGKTPGDSCTLGTDVGSCQNICSSNAVGMACDCKVHGLPNLTRESLIFFAGLLLGGLYYLRRRTMRMG